MSLQTSLKSVRRGVARRDKSLTDRRRGRPKRQTAQAHASLRCPPNCREERECSFDTASNGIVFLSTAAVDWPRGVESDRRVVFSQLFRPGFCPTVAEAAPSSCHDTGRPEPSCTLPVCTTNQEASCSLLGAACYRSRRVSAGHHASAANSALASGALPTHSLLTM